MLMSKLILEFLKDKFERKLFFWSAVAFVCLCAVKIKFRPSGFMQEAWPGVVIFFQSQAFEDVVGDLLTSLIAAYFFYIVIEVFPRMKREQQNVEVLNRLVGSIVDSYSKSHFFGHTMAITEVDLNLLSIDRIDGLITEVKKEPNFVKLKCALFTAHSRYSDFSATLNIASSLGSKRAMQWLVITDKVRLLVENYEEDPESDDYGPQHVYGSGRSEIDENAVDFLCYESDLRVYLSSLQYCVLEYLEQVRDWISPTQTHSPSRAPVNI